jgi:soluble lytic murein transglycosylase
MRLIGWIVGAGLLLAGMKAEGQIYGFTNEKGVLILSNVPSDSRMNLIANGSPEQAGKVWRYNGQYDPLILRAARESGVDHALVKAVIAVESAFNRFARSHKGAQGLMQLMPETARRYGVVNPYDPWQNLRGGTRHLRDLLDEFKDLRLSLAAYNAGATPVRRLRRVPPYRETQDYVKKVLAVYRAGSRLRITKGGRTYSIKRPGGRTVVTPAGSTKAAASPPPAPSPVQPATTPTKTATADGQTAAGPAVEAAGEKKAVQADEPLYYRYRDENGVIYITRMRPSDVEYEVLEP